MPTVRDAESKKESNGRDSIDRTSSITYPSLPGVALSSLPTCGMRKVSSDRFSASHQIRSFFIASSLDRSPTGTMPTNVFGLILASKRIAMMLIAPPATRTPSPKPIISLLIFVCIPCLNGRIHAAGTDKTLRSNCSSRHYDVCPLYFRPKVHVLGSKLGPNSQPVEHGQFRYT